MANAEVMLTAIMNTLYFWDIYHLAAMKRQAHTKSLVDHRLLCANSDVGDDILPLFLLYELRFLIMRFEQHKIKLISRRFFTGPGGMFDIEIMRSINFGIFTSS